jgi:phenylacetate-CoA ligase
VADSFGMSDVWSTMAGECGGREGLHLTTGDGALLELCDPDSGAPIELEDGAAGELVWTHLAREASPLLRYRSADLARVWTTPCPCGRTEPRLRIDGRRDDMLRVRGANVHPQAVGAVLGARPAFGRYAVVADGDPVEPPLRVVVEAPRASAADRAAAEDELRRRLGAAITLTTVPHGTLPVDEHKTQLVYRRAHREALPPALAAALDPKEPDR